MMSGESPYECARRETQEEVGLKLSDDDLHCFGYVSEKNYEGTDHWLMFLFDCRISTNCLPQAIDEGSFNFFSREAIDQLNIPPSDHTLIWPYYDRYHAGFVGLRADCNPQGTLTVIEELKLEPGTMRYHSSKNVGTPQH